MKGSPGFTLVEVMVVTAITIIITGFLITDFSRLRVDLQAATLTALDAIREAQANATSGTIFQGASRCGFGIHFDQMTYLIYAGPNSAAPTDCTAQDRNYNPGTDTIVRQNTLGNNNLEYVISGASDIFFEPPNPTTYIGGSSAVGVSVDIIIRKKNAVCPSPDCQTIHVTTSGQSQIQ